MKDPLASGHLSSGPASTANCGGRNKILIIGAGSAGLALAQGLKKANIPHVIYERDENASRQRNWNMALHWAMPALETLMPDDFNARIQGIQTDPHVPASDADRVPVINGQTGERMGEIKSKKIYRLRRDKFRKLLMEGLDIRWGKALTNIAFSKDEREITASFADGTEDTGMLLVGSDGEYSMVRELLVRDENAKVTPTDFAATMCFSKHSRERALFLRAKPFHPLYQVAPHPDGYFAMLSLHDGDDLEHPENWTFFHYISYPEPRNVANNKSAAEHLAFQKELAKEFCDPFRSVFEWTPDDSPVWYTKMQKWDPSKQKHGWLNHDGRITLAGDAAHLMTFQRGQGLNHALQDSYELCRRIKFFWDYGSLISVDRRAAMITAYENEMRRRGGKQVRLSEANGVAVHDWEKVMQSPSVNMGAHVPSKDAA